MSAIRLDEASVEAVAHRVAELLRGESTAGELVDVAEVARRFNVSRDYVYEHAAELGAVRLGGGPRARLRFDLETVAERLGASAESPPRLARPRRRGAKAPGAELLPVRGSK